MIKVRTHCFLRAHNSLILEHCCACKPMRWQVKFLYLISEKQWQAGIVDGAETQLLNRSVWFLGTKTSNSESRALETLNEPPHTVLVRVIFCVSLLCVYKSECCYLRTISLRTRHLSLHSINIFFFYKSTFRWTKCHCRVSISCLFFFVAARCKDQTGGAVLFFPSGDTATRLYVSWHE